MTPRTLARSAVFLPFLLLAGCLDFELGSSLSWSPAGSELAFVAGGRSWLYSMGSGRLSPLSPTKGAVGLSWSPKGERIALSSARGVELLSRKDGAFFPDANYALSVATAPPLFFSWHPSGASLLVGRFHQDNALTAEISLASATLRELGTGLAFYGPTGDWVLWAAPAEIGRRTKIVFERQNLQGEALAWEPGAAEALALAELGPSLNGSETRAGLTPCFERPLGARTDILCLDPQGAVRTVGVLSARGRVFPDPRRALFAAVIEKDKEEPKLWVLDAKSSRRADGARFLRESLGVGPEGTIRESGKVSRLAWSPDGNWLAWVAEGRLCLWNWRNDEVRIILAPRS